MNDQDRQDTALNERLDREARRFRFEVPAVNTLQSRARARVRLRRAVVAVIAIAIAVLPAALLLTRGGGEDVTPLGVAPPPAAESWKSTLCAEGVIQSTVVTEQGVWSAINASSSSQVVLIDPSTGQVEMTLSAGSHIDSLAVDSGVPWVLEPAQDGTYSLGELTASGGRSFAVAAGDVARLAVSGPDAFIATVSYADYASTLLEVDLSSGSVVSSLPLPDGIPQWVSVHDGFVDVSTIETQDGGYGGAALVRVSRSTMTTQFVVENFDLASEAPDGSVWGARLTSQGSSLSSIAAGSNEVHVYSDIEVRGRSVSASLDRVWFVTPTHLSSLVLADGSVENYSPPSVTIRELDAVTNGVILTLDDCTLDFRPAGTGGGTGS